MAKTVKVWVCVNRDDGCVVRTEKEKPTSPPADGWVWVEMTGELQDPEPPSLLPCPFCGSLARFFPDGGPAMVECSNETCNVMGPRGKSEFVAALAWNRRVGAK
jgi:hypothetical protein